VSEISDSGRFRVLPLARMFTRAAFREGHTDLDDATLNVIVERAVDLFEAGYPHTTRAMLFTATPEPAIATRALTALGDPPSRSRPWAGPTATGEQPAPYDGLPAPRVAPEQVQVLLWEDARIAADGRLVGVYQPVPVLWPPAWCEHVHTLCPHCLLTWVEDHALALFDHGPDGAAVGCQCPTCQPHLPAPPTPTYPDPAPAEAAPPARPTTDDGDRDGDGDGSAWYCRDVTCPAGRCT
jgi:hypothetical protein